MKALTCNIIGLQNIGQIKETIQSVFDQVPADVDAEVRGRESDGSRPLHPPHIQGSSTPQTRLRRTK